MPETINFLGFDIDGLVVDAVIKRLAALKSTSAIESQGAYNFGPVDNAPKPAKIEKEKQLHPILGIFVEDDDDVAVEEPTTVKVFIDTTWSEDQLDDWLYKLKLWRSDWDYGTFERSDCLKKDGYLFDRIECKPISEL